VRSRHPCLWPGGPGHVERETLPDFVQQSNDRAFGVEVVDKGDDRHVAQPADLEEYAGLTPFAEALARAGDLNRVRPSLSGAPGLVAHLEQASGKLRADEP
jgi:hypothetical protein